ncbi:unnamed protein product [Danaus chrysippus]|uniref:(African queen) hypothetical protein n=1 Tax=Danaus chrysippus TaxID=151541 RepID=A0A8J2QTS0_9NEOP|nr:unnamed protein product [Danaus chrysippus]
MRKSKAFVQKWVQRYKVAKNVDDLPERGSIEKVDKKDEERIINLFSRNPALTLRQGQAKLKAKVRCILIRAWSFSTNRLVQRTVKHGIKVHLWGCFSKQGFGTLHLFTDNRNAEKMLKIYKKALLPSAKRWFIKRNEDWILHEDNDPKHLSKLCTEWKAQSGIVTLDWPSQSPYANPIENVWVYIKHKHRERRTQTLKQLSCEIRRIWRSLSVEYAVKLVESMPRRCQAIIDAGGDWTHY